MLLYFKAVEDGLRLSKRLYFEKDKAVAPSKPLRAMEKPGTQSYLLTVPMVYVVIYNLLWWITR